LAPWLVQQIFAWNKLVTSHGFQDFKGALIYSQKKGYRNVVNLCTVGLLFLYIDIFDVLFQKR